MRNDTRMTDASQQYAVAHSAHYESKNSREALVLYQGILAAHPDTLEAGYSRSQILNILKEVVPERELLEAQVGLAMAHFDADRQQERQQERQLAITRVTEEKA